MLELLLDTDVLIKLAAYDLLRAVQHPGCATDCEANAGVLSAATFVARNRLPRQTENGALATERLEAFLPTIEVLEPTNDELTLAAELEAVAAELDVDLDVGESQLCAIAVSRERPIILTGDKRAIVAVEQLMERGELVALKHRLACLEQAMQLAVHRLGALVVRARVVAEKTVDRAVSISFQFTNPNPAADFQPTGLNSYIEDLRSSAATTLLPGSHLTVASVA